MLINFSNERLIRLTVQSNVKSLSFTETKGYLHVARRVANETEGMTNTLYNERLGLDILENFLSSLAEYRVTPDFPLDTSEDNVLSLLNFCFKR